MDSFLPRGPDPRGPCGNEDCSRCYPNQRWFRVSTITVERRRHKREFRAPSAEAALAEYDGGTAWPADYDTTRLETLEHAETVVEELPRSPWIFQKDGGTLIDAAGCWWDLPSADVKAEVP
jgi:hypothetical protein